MRHFTSADYWETIDTLNQGGLGIVPTDTIHGFICRPDARKALDRLKAIKGREDNKPFLLLARQDSAVNEIFSLSPWPEKLFSLWPGPITVIAPILGKPFWANPYTVKDHKVGLRIPNDPFLQTVLAGINGFAVSTSANHQGAPPSNDAQDLIKQFASAIDFLVYKQYNQSPASTIIEEDKQSWRLLREGHIKGPDLLSLGIDIKI